jgi:FtsP/CotA-like multicopper oxidase with cupredoxin domain
MKRLSGGLGMLLMAGALNPAFASPATDGPCRRPAAGSIAAQPTSLYSRNGVLQVAFDYYTSVDKAGRTLFCFVTPDGIESPTLHLHPGDTLDLTVTNRNPAPPPGSPTKIISNASDRCGAVTMTITSANVHFHGTNTAPKCHADEVIHTLINSGQTFRYAVQFPTDEPPGLYWYHPHVHPLTEAAVQGGASGAIVIEGIQNIQPAVAGLPERLLLIRDQTIPNGPAPGGKVPSWDLSLNYVPISYPQDTPAVIEMKPGGEEFWRVVNASADTFIDLRLLYDGAAQPLQTVALDGVPISSHDGKREGRLVTRKDIKLAPAGRAEFIVTAPGTGVKEAIFQTLKVDTGTGGNDPTRALANIVTTASASVLPVIPTAGEAPRPQRSEDLATAKVTASRYLFFAEGGSEFYIVYDGQAPVPYSPDEKPAITTTQGSVEDWTILNQTGEVHAFHIHQLHFLLLERNGEALPAAQQQYLDTVDVPANETVTLRMDFRGKVVGDFVYHCHILEHEDHGMMAIIRVLPKS